MFRENRAYPSRSRLLSSRVYTDVFSPRTVARAPAKRSRRYTRKPILYERVGRFFLLVFFFSSIFRPRARLGRYVIRSREKITRPHQPLFAAGTAEEAGGERIETRQFYDGNVRPRSVGHNYCGFQRRARRTVFTAKLRSTRLDRRNLKISPTRSPLIRFRRHARSVRTVIFLFFLILFLTRRNYIKRILRTGDLTDESPPRG